MRQADFRLYCPAPPDPRPVLLSAVVRTYVFKKAVEPELPAGDPNGQRGLSAIEAAFNHTSIPCPTDGVSPL